MIAKWLKPILVPLLLAILSTNARAEGRDTPPVTLLPNLVSLDDWDRHAVFAASGSQLAAFDRHGAAVWDMASRRLVRSIAYDRYANVSVLTPDEQWVISGHRDNSIQLWNLATGVPAIPLQKPAGNSDIQITALAVSADGALLLAGNDGGLVSVFDLKTHAKLRSFRLAGMEGRAQYIMALRVAADQKHAIALTPGSVRTFEIATGRPVAAYDIPNEKDKSDNAFVADGLIGDDELIAKFAIPGCDVAELRYLNLKDPANTVTVDTPADCHRPEDSDSFGDPSLFVNPAAASVLITRVGVPVMKEWDLKTRSVSRTSNWPKDTAPEVIGVDREFRKAAVSDKQGITLRALDDGASLAAFVPVSYPATAAVLSDDGRTILLAQQTAAKDQQQVTLWDIGAPEPSTILRVAADAETVITDFSRDAKLAAAVTKDGFALFPLETGSEARHFSLQQIKEPWGLRLSPDGKVAALLGDNADGATTAVLVDTSDGRIKRRFNDDKKDSDLAGVTAAAFSPDGQRLALGRFDGTIDLWDVKSASRVKRLPAARGDDADRIWSLRFTPDGKTLLSGSRDSGAFLWRLDSGRPPKVFRYDDDAAAAHPHLASVALSHDGSTVIAGSSQHAVSSADSGRQRSIEVWNAATGKRRTNWLAHETGVAVVTFSPDDRIIVSASLDGTVKYWDARTGKNLATIVVANDGGWAVLSGSGFFAASPDGTGLFSLARGLKARPAADVRKQLERPDLIAELLKGDPDHRYATAAQALDLAKAWDSPAP